MKKTLHILFVLLVCQAIVAQTITVKQDSTGDYIHIQDAIDSAQDGDTVLVWPGSYYENLIINDISIVLGSLTLTTQDKQYNTQTIIDGSADSATCVVIVYCDDFVELNGFTICNGWGHWGSLPKGGGVFFKYVTDGSVKNCIIKDNVTSLSGGGIDITRSNVYLSATNIYNNHAYCSSGGVYVENGRLDFDSISRCNIYLNFSAIGSDIAQFDPSGENPPVQVIVDTFTVQTPDYYYLMDGNNMGEALSYDILHSKIETVKQDLYVSPNGNNSNSGLSPAEPLKDIYFALLKMETDTISPDTIHISNGIYSLNDGEMYPLSLKRDVSLKGTNRDSTILDANNTIYLLNGIEKANNYSIKDLTLTNGNGNLHTYFRTGAFRLWDNKNVLFENLKVTENKARYISGGAVVHCNNARFINVEFSHNIGGNPLRLTNGFDQYFDTIYVNDCQFTENLPDSSVPNEGLGGDVVLIGQTWSDAPNKLTAFFTNCLFANNRARLLENGGGGAAAFHAAYSSQAYLINCTFSENVAESPTSVSIGVTYGSNMHIYNSILYANEPIEIGVGGEEEYPCSLNIYNSLIDGGEEGVKYISDYNTVFYDTETNIDEDPLFLGEWEHPYQIDNGSPCIDAGTINLPDFIEIPEFDLAGNPRIVGGSIDIGAYEWNPTVDVDEADKVLLDKLLQVFPNPAENIVNLSVNPGEEQKIVIYDMAGQVVLEKTVSQASLSIDISIWKQGLYLFTLSEGGRMVQSEKVLVR
ncbi:MAG: hypothetical protein DRJ05_05245 [Bacteroidetes bacterium]|nr:MAG: hypothetical protein DRI89_06970 [Bacteroidota bacterium]RLD60120.1 MAG: hypothetical protein DRJ05_05245 [Bacteroidota bacterium]